MDVTTRTGCTSFNKVKFLAALQSIRHHTFKKRTIQHSRRKTSLIPYNPNIVLSKIRDDDVNTYQAIPQAQPPSPAKNKREWLNPRRVLSLVKTYKGLIDHIHWLQRYELPKLSRNARVTLQGAYELALACENAFRQMRSDCSSLGSTRATETKQACPKE